MSIHYPCMWAQSVMRIAVGPSILIELRLASRRYVHSLGVHVWCFWRDTQYYIDRQTTSWNRGPVCFKKGFFLRQNLFFKTGLGHSFMKCVWRSILILSVTSKEHTTCTSKECTYSRCSNAREWEYSFSPWTFPCLLAHITRVVYCHGQYPVCE